MKVEQDLPVPGPLAKVGQKSDNLSLKLEQY